MMKIGLGLVSHIEPILKEIIEITGEQKHGEPQLIELKEKKITVSAYPEYFETEHDAQHFFNFVTQVYAMKKDQLPPMHVLAVLFKALIPIMQPKKLIGEQSHGKPEIRKLEKPDGKFTHAVILKEVFTDSKDAQDHIAESKHIQNLRL